MEAEGCRLISPWQRRLLVSMVLTWPSAIRLAVGATLLAAVGVTLFTLPVEKEKVKYYDLATERRAEFEKAMTQYNRRKENGGLSEESYYD